MVIIITIIIIIVLKFQVTKSDGVAIQEAFENNNNNNNNNKNDNNNNKSPLVTIDITANNMILNSGKFYEL